MKMRSSQKVNENKDRDDKIKLMQDRQRQWMEQRSRNSDQESDRPNNKPSSATLLTRRPMSGRAKPKSDSKKSNKDVLLWTSKNPEAIHDGFVVRKQSSARSDKSNKGLSSRNRDDDGRPGSGRRSGKSDKRTYANSTNSNEMDEKRKEHRTSTPDNLKDRQLPVTQLAKEISSINVSTSDRLYASSHDDIPSSYDSKKYRNIADDDIMPASSVNTQPYISKEARLDQKKEEKTSSPMFSMHCCPSCRKLMYQQSHFPFLIIPCGHNICSRCCSEQSACPTCNAKIKSTVENVTLSHVISEHKKQEEKEELAKRENEARKYINEYDSLKTRCEVLSCKFTLDGPFQRLTVNDALFSPSL